MSKVKNAPAPRPKRVDAIYILADREDPVSVMDAGYLADYLKNGLYSYLTAGEAEEGRKRGDAYDDPARTRVVGIRVKPFLPKKERRMKINYFRSYYFTFGCEHPLSGFAQRVFASSEAKARATMFTFYGDRWVVCYGPFSGITKYGDDGRMEDLDPLDFQTWMVDLGGCKYHKIEKDLTEGDTL